jgi:hypothetical protein
MEVVCDCHQGRANDGDLKVDEEEPKRNSTASIQHCLSTAGSGVSLTRKLSHTTSILEGTDTRRLGVGPGHPAFRRPP